MRNFFKKIFEAKPKSTEYKFSNGLSLRTSESSVFAFDYFENDDHMKKELNTFIRLAEGKKFFLDIGALYGLFCMAYLTVNKSGGNAWSFEPSPRCQDSLLQNRDLTASVRWTHVAKAVGSDVGTLQMHFDWNHLIVSEKKENPEIELFEIDMISIDKYCSSNDIKPDIIKIDVEGFEGDVLLGAKRTLLEYKPIIFIELHANWLAKHNKSTDMIVDFLQKLNYTIFDLDLNVVKEPYEYCKDFGARIVAMAS